MKKLLVIFVAILASVIAYSQSENGIIINGVEWATRNVGSPGEFVANIQEYGNFYTYNQAQTACPAGWRIPTQEEFICLIKSGREWGKMNGVICCVFGRDGDNGVFLPLAGQRDYVRGKVEKQGVFGYYWANSDSPYGEMEHYLFLELGGRATPNYFLDIKTGCPVRCVRIID